MWLWSSLSSAFDFPVHDGRLQLYRILLGAAMTWKTAASTFLGDWRRLQAGSFGRYQLAHRRGERAAGWIAAVHKPLLAARLPCCVLLLAGALPKLAIVVIVAGLVQELLYEYRFNTIYLALCALFLLPAGDLGSLGTPSASMSSANTWSQFLIVVLTIDVYWNSAYQKLRSPHFSSGLLLAQLAYVAGAVRPLMPGWEYWHPPIGASRSVAAGPVALRWRLLAAGVVLVEVLLPVGLLWEPLRPFAIGVGVLMHLAFLGILPLRLVPFTLTTLASYLLFAP